MSIGKGCFSETSDVRVATFKKSGKRFLLSFFHGATAHLFGEMQEFKGLRSRHSAMFVAHESEITWADAKKTPALCYALLMQAAAGREHVAVQKTAQGAMLFSLEEQKAEESTKAALGAVIKNPGLSYETRQAVLSAMLRRE